MAISEPYELDGVTVGTAPISVVSGTTTVADTAISGVYQLWIDAGVMAKGDEFRITLSEKVEATGGVRKTFATFNLQGVQTEVFVTPTFILLNGWNMTIHKLAGTDRAFDASIRKVA
ncbi:MAG: hypothetical protein H0W39_01045 [Sphingomonas sp.]|nr:hypothetical protein [Sphingomonas sp.]